MNVTLQRHQLLSATPVLPATPLICFSHLRWDFVLQRPQHLMERFAKERPVYYFEEYIPTEHHLPYLEFHPFAGSRVIAVRPRVPQTYDEAAREKALAGLLDTLLLTINAKKPMLWFYTPMMFSFARHVDASAVVYDCMDELANFRFAPPRLKQLEADLMRRSEVVFTGGYSLYEAKRKSHPNIHPFPSSVDVAHFRTARRPTAEPADQAGIKGPRLGFYGVLDERLDTELLRAVAQARPDWSFVMLGPVVKIAPEDLPQAPNLHYLGPKAYADLPKYLAGWDVALMPFAINEATRFISPTKTPEYLASGRPVVSTPIPDVKRHYGDIEAVFIASDAEGFIAACEKALALQAQKPASWLQSADILLASQSWDQTFLRMREQIELATGGAHLRTRTERVHDGVATARAGQASVQG